GARRGRGSSRWSSTARRRDGASCRCRTPSARSRGRMFSGSADLYDRIYASFKDYAQEARDIAALLCRAHPRGRTVLDVACGTGEHARLLAAEHGLSVDGLDLDPAFVRIASAKHPGGRFEQADMMD